MTAAALINVVLMAFVLLAPTVMVAVLVSGLSRRPAPVGAGAGPEPDPAEAAGLAG